MTLFNNWPRSWPTLQFREQRLLATEAEAPSLSDFLSILKAGDVPTIVLTLLTIGLLGTTTLSCSAQGPLAYVAPSDVPFRGAACGLFKRRRSSARSRVVDEGGDEVPHAWHTAKGDSASMLHAVMRDGRSALYSVSAPDRKGRHDLPQVAVEEHAPGDFSVGEGELRPWSLTPDGVLSFEDLEIRLLPLLSPQHPLTWELKHHCDAWADFLGQGRSIHGLEVTVHLRFLSGQSLHACELGVRILAGERSGLREGLGFRVVNDGTKNFQRVSFHPSGQSRGIEASNLIFHHDADGWFQGAEHVSPDGRCAFSLHSDGHPQVSLQVLGGVAKLQCEGDGERAEVLVRPASDELSDGESALFRATIAIGGVPQRPGSALLVPHRSVALATTSFGLKLARGTLNGPAVGAIRKRATRWLTEASRGRPYRSGRNRGDWSFSYSDVGNLEYDTTLGLLQRAYAERNPLAWQYGLAAADHLLTTDYDAHGSGLFFPHGRSHRSAPLELGHHWVEGVMLLRQWTQDPLIQDIVEDMCKRLEIRLEECDLNRELPRSLSWSLLAISSICRQWPQRKRAKAQMRRLRDFILKRQLPLGIFALSKSQRASPFVQGGILLPALTRCLVAEPRRTTRKSIKRLSKALMAKAIVKEDKRWLLARQLHWNARGRDVARAGSAPGEHMALVCAGLMSALPEAQNHPSVQGLMRDFVAQLRCDKKQHPGPEISILLRALPTFLSGE